MDSLDQVNLRPLDESPNEFSSQSTIAIPLRYIYMKMRRVISADILDRAEVGNVIQVTECYWNRLEGASSCAEERRPELKAMHRCRAFRSLNSIALRRRRVGTIHRPIKSSFPFGKV